MKNIRSFLGAAGVAAVAALSMSTAALADDDANKFGYSITISGTSDYIFRGISLSNQDPAFQPFIEFTYGNPKLTWYLDFWGSNIAGKDPGPAPFELDIYAGVRPVTGPINWDLGVLYYTYPANSFFGDKGGDYVEFKVAASITPITNLTVGVTGYYTPDQGTNYQETATVEGNWAYTLPNFYQFTPTVGGVIGYSKGFKSDDPFQGSFCGCDTTDAYTYWSVGLKLAVDKYFMDFRYWDTDIGKSDAAHDLADSRFVFTAGVNLP